ncbi:hypothetical protein [Kineococcus sp. R86509]|uniref:hypothetical protein n=1 Tax=Kineococcus sp. R86509 TaxID=3093851 RepID=UPI0036D24E14
MEEEPVVLGAVGIRRAVVTAVGALVVVGVLGWWNPWGVAGVVGYVGGYVVLAALCVVWSVLVHRADRVRLEAEAVVVVRRSGETSYPWAEVLEVSWSTTTWPYAGSGPVLRLRGGAYDTPGPNAPAQIASLPVFGRGAAESVALLRRAAEVHGVTYTPKLLELITTGKRSPRLPGERRDARGGSL